MSSAIIKTDPDFRALVRRVDRLEQKIDEKNENQPTRSDYDAQGYKLDSIEDSLARIERKIDANSADVKEMKKLMGMK